MRRLPCLLLLLLLLPALFFVVQGPMSRTNPRTLQLDTSARVHVCTEATDFQCVSGHHRNSSYFVPPAPAAAPLNVFLPASTSANCATDTTSIRGFAAAASRSRWVLYPQSTAGRGRGGKRDTHTHPHKSGVQQSNCLFAAAVPLHPTSALLSNGAPREQAGRVSGPCAPRYSSHRSKPGAAATFSSVDILSSTNTRRAEAGAPSASFARTCAVEYCSRDARI